MRTILVLTSLLAALVMAPAADASRLDYDPDGTLVYTAAAGETNAALVSASPYATTCGPVAPPCIHLIDWGAHLDLTAVPAACSAANKTDGWPQYGEAVCPVPPRLRAALGDMNDTWTDWDGPSAIDAGPGDDNPIDGAGGNDVIAGGGGNDVLIGGTGDDALDGGPGDDDFEGIPGEGLFGSNPPSQGTDRYTGGGGGDAVLYTGRAENLSLSLDGVANDGAPGERDDIGPDVTTVLGGSGDDAIAGNEYANALSGDTGNDAITGAGGDDRLFGASGSDRLDAGAGQDYLEGGNGDDVLTGGPDVDTFYGEDPLCTSSSCTGRDQVFARDGRAEFVACGAGIDSAQVDAADQVRNWIATDDQCESVDAGASGAAVAGSGFKLSRVTARARRITVSTVVPGAGVVTVRAVGHHGGRTIPVGRRSRRSLASGPLSVTLAVSAAARRAVRRIARLRTTVTVRFAPSGGGAAKTASRSVTLH